MISYYKLTLTLIKVNVIIPLLLCFSESYRGISIKADYCHIAVNLLEHLECYEPTTFRQAFNTYNHIVCICLLHQMPSGCSKGKLLLLLLTTPMPIHRHYADSWFTIAVAYTISTQAI